MTIDSRPVAWGSGPGPQLEGDDRAQVLEWREALVKRDQARLIIAISQRVDDEVRIERVPPGHDRSVGARSREPRPAHGPDPLGQLGAESHQIEGHLDGRRVR